MLLEEAFNAIIQQESHVKARWGSSAPPPDLSDSAERTDLIGAPQTLLLLRVNCLKKPESSSNKEYEGLLYKELVLGSSDLYWYHWLPKTNAFRENVILGRFIVGWRSLC